MEVDQRGDVHVRHAVAIGQAEGLVSDDILGALQASAGHRVDAGIQHGHFPGQRLVVRPEDLAGRQVDREVAGPAGKVKEVVLDELDLVAAQHHKVGDAVGRIHFHDVVQDRAPADFDHRLRPQGRFLAQARTETACKNDCLHALSIPMAAARAGSGYPAPPLRIGALAMPAPAIGARFRRSGPSSRPQCRTGWRSRNRRWRRRSAGSDRSSPRLRRCRRSA